MKIVVRIIRVREEEYREVSKRQSTLDKIIAKTGRQITACNCESCRSQCRTPCLGTPDDILKLIEAGYKDKLAPTLWMHGMVTGNLAYPVKMIQPIKQLNSCIFYNDGLCELHDLGLKPSEGKLSHHSLILKSLDFDTSVTWNVAKEWIEVRNIPTIIKVINAYME